MNDDRFDEDNVTALIGEMYENIKEKADEPDSLKEDVLIIRGLNVYASELEQCLEKLDGVNANYQVSVDIEHNFDVINVHVSLAENMAEADVNTIGTAKEKVSDAIYAVTGLKPEIFIESNRNAQEKPLRKVIISDRRKNAQN